MGISRILRYGLFIYECVRTVVLAFSLAFLLPNSTAIPWMAFTAAGALFPLMALFIWIDIDRYKSFLSLYMGGKCIGIFAFLSWSVINRNFTMITIFLSAEILLVVCDILALAAAYRLILKIRKTEETTADMQKEEVQCE